MSSSITSPSRPAELPRHRRTARPAAARWPARRRPRPWPAPPVGASATAWATILRRSTPVGHGDRAGRADRGDLGTDPRQPEGAGGVAVAVVADEIPAALLGDHTPRFDGPRGVGLGPRRAGAGTAPLAENRWPTTGFPGHPRTRADPAPRPPRRWPPAPPYRRVDVDPGGPQLEQRALRRGDQFRRLPQLGGDGHRGRLVRGQLDGRQRVGVAVDPVALGGVQRRHPADLQRDAEVAQLVLVALEHPGERLVAGAVRIARDAGPDLSAVM